MATHGDDRILYDDNQVPTTIGISLTVAVTALSRFVLSTGHPYGSPDRIGRYFPVVLVFLVFALLRPLRTTVKRQGDRVELEVKHLFSAARHRFDRSQIKAVRYRAPFALELVSLVTDEREFRLVKRIRYRFALEAGGAKELAEALGVPFDRG